MPRERSLTKLVQNEKVFVRNISNQHGLMYKKEESIFARQFQYPEFWNLQKGKLPGKVF